MVIEKVSGASASARHPARAYPSARAHPHLHPHPINLPGMFRVLRRVRPILGLGSSGGIFSCSSRSEYQAGSGGVVASSASASSASSSSASCRASSSSSSLSSSSSCLPAFWVPHSAPLTRRRRLDGYYAAASQTARRPSGADKLGCTFQARKQFAAFATTSGSSSSSSTGVSYDAILDALRREDIDTSNFQAPEESFRAVCPACQGGSKGEMSLAVVVKEGGKYALAYCHRATCDMEGEGRRISIFPNASKPPADSVRTAPNPPAESDAFFNSNRDDRESGGEAAGRRIPSRPLFKPSNDIYTWFASRQISRETVDRARAMMTRDGRIAFPFYKEDAIVNVKYRAVNKQFSQEKGAEKVLYGLETIERAMEEGRPVEVCYIVEGEMDRLSLMELGVEHVLSVPDGAPAKVKGSAPPPVEEDKKFDYLWNCRKYLEQVEKFVLATDADDPGLALAEELSRRLGKERCWRVRWPKEREKERRKRLEMDRRRVEASSGSQVEGGVAYLDGVASDAYSEEMYGIDGIEEEEHEDEVEEEQEEEEEGDDYDDAMERLKDANDTLQYDAENDSELVRQCLEEAEPYPIRGLFQFSDYWDEIEKYYYLQSGNEGGISCGWRDLDNLYRVVPGELTIVTGVPNSGKSEWVDALMVNLAHNNDWSFAICSMENLVRDHCRKLLEKHTGKPFFPANVGAGYASSDRFGRTLSHMTPDDLDNGKVWLNNHFHLIRCEDDQLPSMEWVLGLAKAAVLRYGIRGLVIDPYNELDHQRPKNETETEYVSRMLTQMKRFAQHHDVHVFFVAHPRQMQQWRGEPPGLYDISGSAHFMNKCDNGIVVHRNRNIEAGPLDQVTIYVRKVRNKAAGTIGEAHLRYERGSGRYMDYAPGELDSVLPPSFDSSNGYRKN